MLDKITKQIISKAFPAVLEQILNTVIVISSTFIVSGLGEAAILATSWNGIVYNFFMAIFMGLATATTVLIGREYGRNNINRVKILLQHSIIIGIILSTTIGILAYFFAGNLFELLFGRGDPESLKLAIQYARVTLTLIPLTALEFVFVGALRGITNNKIPLITALIMNALNIAVSFILIKGIFFPSLGIMGSAIGVSVARLTGLIFIVCYTFFRNEIYKNIKFVYKMTKTFSFKIIKLGIPSMMEQFILTGGFMILAMVLVKLSTEQQTAYNISTNLNTMIWGPSSGISVTMTALISKTIGENRWGIKDRTLERKYVNKAFKITFAVSIFQMILFWFLAEPLVNAFSDNPSVISSGIFCARCFAVLAPFLSLVMVEAGILRGAGRANYVTMSSFIALWIFRILVVYILLYQFNLQVSAVFLGVFLDFGSRALLYYLKIRDKSCFEYEI